VNNNVGVVGVAPEAELLIVRGTNNVPFPVPCVHIGGVLQAMLPSTLFAHYTVFEGASSQFTASSLVAALEECRNGGADIINMSLGGASSSVVERNKVSDLFDQGIQLIAASGNSGDTSNPMEYPASYDEVISVGAVDEERKIAPFSTHNAKVDVSAPGLDVLSLVQTCSSCYARFSGTSMAAPHVSGVFALLMSKYPNKSISQIREALEESAVDNGACGLDTMFGHGIVDVVAAANYLENGSKAPDLTGCVNTKVTVGTDKWGSEISYVIRNSAGDVVYKNGPYTNEVKTYTDDFQLPEDCYEFEMVDSYGECRYTFPFFHSSNF
jgi:serine protease